MLPPIRPLAHHNYVAFFLTLACNLKCSYCINHHDIGSGNRNSAATRMSSADWIEAANRLQLRSDLPLTLQGGEPTLHPAFYDLVKWARKDIRMDLMTNMMFDVDTFIRNVPVERFTRNAPYASIRVSYHPGQNDIDSLICKTITMQEAGFRVGLYGIEHPEPGVRKHIYDVREKCLDLGLDFRLKDFLGRYDGKLYGTFKYEDCVGGDAMKWCECRTTEIIVDPAGYVYKCHADLYKGRNPIAHILDSDFSEHAIEHYRMCGFYGDCNPCDVKVKTNRFQVFGHTSVEMRMLPSIPQKSGSQMKIEGMHG